MQIQAVDERASVLRAAVLAPPLVVEGLRRLGCHIVAHTGFTAQLPIIVARSLPSLLLAHIDGRDFDGLLGSLRQVRTVAPALRLVVLLPAQPDAAWVEALSVINCEILAHDVDTVSLQLLLGIGMATPNLLTRREIEALTLAAEGLSNHGIGRRMGVQMNTVKNYLRSVHRKLGAHSRTEAVVIAARAGYPVLAEVGAVMPSVRP